MRVGDLFSVAVQGLQRQVDDMDSAANQVLMASTAPSTPDRVSVSNAAKQAALGGGDSLTSGIEGGLIDMRVSKYLAVANLKVLQTGDELTQDLTNLVEPSSG
jgi:hypothetical protein